MAEQESTATQRSFGRGYAEGLKAAGVENIGEVMSAARMKSMEDGLSGIQRKVYDCIPVSAPPITFPQIMAELKDRFGTRPEHALVKSCVGYLLDKKLVRSVEDKLIRARTKPVIVGAVEPNEPTPEAPPASRSADPIERMADIECRLKALAKEVIALAEIVGDVAVDAEMSIQKIRDDNAKVSQLKELLKNL